VRRDGGDDAGGVRSERRTFREEANDRIYETAVDHGSTKAEFICECADELCIAVAPIYLAAYRAIRDIGRPVLADGHKPAP